MFKFMSAKNQSVRNGKIIEQMNARQNRAEVANTITFVTLAENGTIDDVTATEHTDLFSAWVSGMAYAVGDLRQYENKLYRCIQAHTSQEDWKPDEMVSLWSKVGDPAEEYPAWSQPVGAHDAYAKGDKVTHNGKKWTSAVDGNVWEPGVYGWDAEAEATEEAVEKES